MPPKRPATTPWMAPLYKTVNTSHTMADGLGNPAGKAANLCVKVRERP